MMEKTQKKRRKSRIEKAQSLLKAGLYPVKLGDSDNYYVPSQSDMGRYFVTKTSHGWSCDCFDYLKRKGLCKHIYAVILWKSMGELTTEKQKKKLVCKFCESENFIKYGKAGRKQVYKCKDCGRKFVNNIHFEKMKYDSKIIAMTLDLYFRGLSLRKIANHLKQFHGLSLSHVAIYKWIEKYISIIDAYVSQLEPRELSDIWHIDEMMVKVAGDWKYLWNSLDEGTRFHLAGHISNERYVEDARRAFQKAKNNGRHRNPKYIITDGLQSYKKAVRKEFVTRTKKTVHIHNVGIRDKINNNVLERLQGTVREREKIIRGLKKEETPILKGQRIFYNYIRPHQSLAGATPSQIACIDLQLSRNRWLDLLEKSLGATTELTP